MTASTSSLNPFSIAQGLPVQDVLPELCAVLAQNPTTDHPASAILVAPPGAGKTTSVPPVLAAAAWRAPSDKIIMLEPRRLAARAAAQRIASLMGEDVGGFVGFRTRLESAVSDRTRIEVLTEGLFLRRLLGDPMLEGVACVILDEIHERSLDADLALAFCLDLQRTLRPDLRLVAMSATAETERLAALMNAPVLTSEGRMFPLTVHHAKHDIPSLRDIATATATGVRQALAETEGDILTFLPGTGEIRRVMQLLDGVPATVLPLHGELHPAEQARVLRPGNEGERRVILATSIAETSLTVPGVRVVVDCGFRRVPRFDAGAGLSRLDTVRISKAAVRQRAGRAGREAPGMAYCLWSAHTERALPQHDRPEILEADLSDFVLATALWADTVGSADTPLPLPDQPPGSAVAAAKELLILLGALDDAGQITKLGCSMADLGTHPRLAAMMLAARTAEEAALAADLAALLEERDPLRPRAAVRGGPPPIPPADITLRLDLIAGEDNNPQADRGALARIRQAAARFRTRMGLKARHPAAGDAAALLAAGFPDRIALCRGDMGSYRMANGSNARLRRDDGLAKHKLLAVAGLHLRTAAEIRMAAPLDSNALPPALLERTREQVETTLDPVSGNIMARRRTRIGCLVLRDRTEKVKPEDAGPLLLAQAKEAPETTLNWSDAVKQLQARVELARTLPGGTGMEEEWPDFSSTALAACMDEWLTPYVEGCTSITALRELDILNLLRTYLGYARTSWLDKELPTTLPFPGGVAEVDYTQPVPVASARAQAFYGTAETPKLAGGRVPLRLALLSPAGRPQAITADLAGFWQGGWADMRRDMRGRYPKHEWPENPALAPARPRAKRS